MVEEILEQLMLEVKIRTTDRIPKHKRDCQLLLVEEVG